MSRRNYKELWEQLKVVVMYGGRQRYSTEELCKIIGNLEIGQLCQDPMRRILEVSENGKETLQG